MHWLASATALTRFHSLPPSEIKSLYGSTTSSAVISFSNLSVAMFLPFRRRMLMVVNELEIARSVAHHPCHPAGENGRARRPSSHLASSAERSEARSHVI